MDFCTGDLKFYIPLQGASLKKDKELYDEQVNHLGSALLINDYDPNINVDQSTINKTIPFAFPKDALISGSFVMHHVGKCIGGVNLSYDDVDIYFKTKVDAQQFLTMNNISGFVYGFHFDSAMCSYGKIRGIKFNLIYGVEYDSPAHLISRFDIRACSMAIDPNALTLHAVRGAIEDATERRITFNPIPRGVSVRRLTKYIKKGFTIDGYQSLFFVELVRSHLYSAELELMTKEY